MMLGYTLYGIGAFCTSLVAGRLLADHPKGDTEPHILVLLGGLIAILWPGVILFLLYNFLVGIWKGLDI